MSAGTAIINAAPISWLDGEWIIQALSYILFTPTQELRKRVMRVVKFFTWLLAFNFVLGVIVIFAAYAR